VARIFISYRRADDPFGAVAIRDRLVARFGKGNVFFDLDTIPLGENFRESIEQAVADCDFFVAVIGPLWLSICDEDGQPRLNNPNDFVRLEIKAALKRGIPVIPVLLQDVRLPDKKSLPPDLVDLADRQAIAISPLRDLQHQLDKLVSRIEEQDKQGGEATGEGPSERGPGRLPRARTAALAILFSGVLSAIGLYALTSRVLSHEPEETPPQADAFPPNFIPAPDAFPDVRSSGLQLLTDQDRLKPAYKSSVFRAANKTGSSIWLDLAYEPHETSPEATRASRFFHRLEGPIVANGIWESTETDFGGPIHLSVYSYADNKWHPSNRWFDLLVVPARTVSVHQTSNGFSFEVRTP